VPIEKLFALCVFVPIIADKLLRRILYAVGLVIVNHRRGNVRMSRRDSISPVRARARLAHRPRCGIITPGIAAPRSCVAGSASGQVRECQPIPPAQGRQSFRAIYANCDQMITTMAPFIVALLGVTVLREKLAPFTVPALILSLLGTVLMTVGDPFHIGVDLMLSADDWLGIALAFASAFFLALYMVLIRRSVQRKVPPESLLLMQTVSLVVILGGISLFIGEDWTRWQQLAWQDWSVFLGFALLSITAGNAVQMSALKNLPASLVSSLMPWRFVVTVLLAFVLLGEHITSAWQGLGMAIVFGTITWYLWKQNKPTTKNNALVE